MHHAGLVFEHITARTVGVKFSFKIYWEAMVDIHQQILFYQSTKSVLWTQLDLFKIVKATSLVIVTPQEQNISTFIKFLLPMSQHARAIITKLLVISAKESLGLRGQHFGR